MEEKIGRHSFSPDSDGSLEGFEAHNVTTQEVVVFMAAEADVAEELVGWVSLLHIASDLKRSIDKFELDFGEHIHRRL